VEATPKLLYSKREAAHILSLSLRTIDYYIASGALAARRKGRRVLLEYGELQRFASQDHPATKQRNGAAKR